MIRRTLSIIFYVFAGMFIISEMMIAFFDLEAGKYGSWPFKLFFLGVFIGIALIPFALGVWISPGSRLNEVGVVLFSAAIVAAAEVAIVTFLVLMPDTAKLFFHYKWPAMDIGGGIANLMLIGGVGWGVMKHFPKKSTS